MDKEIKNSLEVGELIDEIKKVKTFKGILLSFSPYILYRHNGIEDRERLKVSIETEGYGYGTITIDDGDLIIADTHHLRFTTIYQNYHFNKSTKTFEITGISEKMGNYKVIILLDENI